MSELLPITVFSILMAVAVHWFSIYDYDTLSYRKKNLFLYVILIAVMAGFVGLRTAYNDTYTYTYAYNLLEKGTNPFTAAGNWLAIGGNPGFNFVNAILVNLGFSAQSFLMFYAVITVGIYLWFIRKYTTNIWFSIFLFITTGCYTFTLAAIKQCFAVAIALIGVDFALRKKWVPFVVFVLLASLFHPYALMFLIVPFMTYRPWSGRGYVLLVVFLVIGFSLQQMLGTLVDITTLLGEDYDVSSFSGEGVNVFRLAVCAVPLALSFVGRKTIAAEASKTDNLVINLSILNAEIMFVGLFGTANYFGRLANYFQIFQVLSIPWLMRIFKKKSAQLVTGAAVVCYIIYFYYANAVNQPFDDAFNSISIFQYLLSLF